MSGTANKASFFGELQRRHVYKVGAMYAVAGWLLVQVATQVFPFFEISNAAVRWVVIAVVAGFPIALVLAWLFDLTPEGIVRTADLAAGGETPAAVRTRSGVDRKLNYVLGALVLIGAAYFVAERTLMKTASAVPVATKDEDKSVAVLPFENLSDEKSNAYFAEGMQDEILTRLSKIHSLKVISRTSTMHIASSPDNLSEIAQKLGVAAILEGSVQKAGDMVHVNVQLIRAASDEHLWAESYNRKLDDVFAVQGEVAQAVAEALSAQLTGAEQQQLAQRPTSNTQAYEAYLRGLALEGRYTAATDDIRKRVDAYQAAVDADPTFASAWSGLARAQTEIYFVSDHTPQQLALAKQALDQATRLAPEASETYEALGMYRYWGLSDYDAAFDAYSKALLLRPTAGGLIYAMGNVRRRQGRWSEALELQNRASQLDPLNTQTWFNLGLSLRALRRYDEAQQAFDRGLAALPGDSALLAEKVVTDQMRGDLSAAAKLAEQLPLDWNDGTVLSPRFDQWRYQRDYSRIISESQQVLQRRASLTPEILGGVLYARGSAELLNQQRDAGIADLNDARKIYETGLQHGDDSPWNYVPLTAITALLGDSKAAIRYSDLAAAGLANDSIGQVQAKLLQAFARLHSGDKQQGLALLAQALTMPMVYGESAAQLQVDPLFDDLRDDAAFQKVVADGLADMKTPIK